MPTTIQWPILLPKPLRAGHGETAGSASIPSRYGLVNRSRRIYSSAPAEISASWKFTAEELWYFRGFYEHELNDGNEYFLCPVYVGGVLEAREVSFLGQSLQTLLAGVSHGRLTVTLTTRRGTAMDRATWDAIQGSGGLAGYYELMLAAALAVNQEGDS